MTAQPEAKLSRQIMLALRRRGAFCFKVHGGPTMMSGLPDIIGVYKGRFFGIESKMPGNDATPVQQLRHVQIRAAGGIAEVARSVAEALTVLDRIDDEGAR